MYIFNNLKIKARIKIKIIGIKIKVLLFLIKSFLINLFLLKKKSYDNSII